MNDRGIGISNLPNQRCTTPFRNRVNYNIIIIGANGLGKTTFINMLLDTNMVPYNIFSQGQVDSYGLGLESNQSIEEKRTVEDSSEWHKDNAINFQNYVIKIDEKGFGVDLCIIEIDNLGDSTCNEQCWMPVEDYIKKQFINYQKDDNAMIRSKIRDSRINACLFFLEPNISGLRDIDICVMKRVSKLCNLIPVVAKSDLLTSEMCRKASQVIQKNIVDNGIKIFGSNTEESIQKYGELPYFLIAFSKNKDGEYLREYPWGFIHIRNTEINDFFKLKDLLVKKGFCELKSSTENFYREFRKLQLIKKYEVLGLKKMEEVYSFLKSEAKNIT